MKRIAILGSSGAGKSTLARELGRLLDLPVIHLDGQYWSAGWTPMPDDEWEQTMRRLVAADEWVMDGNYGRMLTPRLERADAVIWLNMSPWLATWRVLIRWIRYRGRSRPDVPEGCLENLDWEFLRILWTYRKRHASLRARLDQYPVRVIELRSPRQVRAFLTGLGPG